MFLRLLLLPMEKQEMADKQETSSRRTGLYSGLMASALLGIMAVATRRSTADIPATELLFIRSASSIVAVSVLQPSTVRRVAGERRNLVGSGRCFRRWRRSVSC